VIEVCARYNSITLEARLQYLNFCLIKTVFSEIHGKHDSNFWYIESVLHVCFRSMYSTSKAHLESTFTIFILFESIEFWNWLLMESCIQNLQKIKVRWWYTSGLLYAHIKYTLIIYYFPLHFSSFTLNWNIVRALQKTFTIFIAFE